MKKAERARPSTSGFRKRSFCSGVATLPQQVHIALVGRGGVHRHRAERREARGAAAPRRSRRWRQVARRRRRMCGRQHAGLAGQASQLEDQLVGRTVVAVAGIFLVGATTSRTKASTRLARACAASIPIPLMLGFLSNNLGTAYTDQGLPLGAGALFPPPSWGGTAGLPARWGSASGQGRQPSEAVGLHKGSPPVRLRRPPSP